MYHLCPLCKSEQCALIANQKENYFLLVFKKVHFFIGHRFSTFYFKSVLTRGHNLSASFIIGPKATQSEKTRCTFLDYVQLFVTFSSESCIYICACVCVFHVMILRQNVVIISFIRVHRICDEYGIHINKKRKSIGMCGRLIGRRIAVFLFVSIVCFCALKFSFFYKWKNNIWKSEVIIVEWRIFTRV